MAQDLQPVRGTHDLLPDSYAQHQRVIESAQAVARLYGFHRMDTPIFEFSEVFHRAVGDSSDIVTKETYTFTDRGGDSITLRPEFTAAMVRAFISNGLQQNLPFKAFYAGPAFRYERPQKGRLRQFHQIGCELLGAAEPAADVEMMALGMQVLRKLGLSSMVKLEINSLGDVESRSNYRDALVAYLSQYEAKLSDDSKLRLGKNPLRILDSKDAGDREIIAGAPNLHASFNEASAQHFAKVKAGLDALGIAYKVSEKLVRGLDYYSHTVFEVTTDKLGSQGTVLAGGRYDGLVKLMGGQDIAGIGFAAGVERLVALMDQNESNIRKPVKISIIPFDAVSEAKAWEITQRLRGADVKDPSGLVVEMDYKGNAKKRMERANKNKFDFVILLSEQDIEANSIKLKSMLTGAPNIFESEHHINILFESSADLRADLEKFCQKDS